MKDRIALLAGLVEEDDLDEVRDRVVESYEQQFEYDVKEFSENVSVIQEDKYVFAKMLSEMRAQTDISEEMINEFAALPLEVMDILDSLVKGGDELVRHNPEVRDELMNRELLYIGKDGKFILTDKAYDFLGISPVDEAYSYRMTPGSHFVEPREDHYDEGDESGMHSKNPEYPNGWKFYENDPTYLKLKAQAEDPLDLEETGYLADKFGAFTDKYNKDKS